MHVRATQALVTEQAGTLLGVAVAAELAVPCAVLRRQIDWAGPDHLHRVKPDCSAC